MQNPVDIDLSDSHTALEKPREFHNKSMFGQQFSFSFGRDHPEASSCTIRKEEPTKTLNPIWWTPF